MTVFHYNSLQEFLALATAKRTKKGWKKSSDGFDHGKNDSANFKQAVDWAFNGRQIEGIENRATDDTFIHDTFSFEAVNSVAGGVVNMGEFLVGNPECMFDYQQLEVPKVARVISIDINMSVPWRFNNDDIKQAGLKILNALNNIEMQGYSMNINTVLYVTDDGKKRNSKSVFSINSKKSGEPLNVNQFFSLVSGDFVRRFYFKFAETLFTGTSELMKETYGKATQLGKNEGINITDVISENWSVEHIEERIFELAKLGAVAR